MSGPQRQPRLGIALGGGAARGWAHIGVLKALGEMGLRPEVVAGTSVGAVVGAAYASGHLEDFERWVRKLTRRRVLGLLDVALVGGGGLIEGKRLANLFRERFGDLDFDQLDRPFAAVATELDTGREVWLREGSVVEALRASVALPGLFTPAKLDGRWLLDGGLVNPVPVTLCHALGADVVIAVNLDGDGAGGRDRLPARDTEDPGEADEGEDGLLDRLTGSLREGAASVLAPFRQAEADPGLFDILARSIYIMQVRITRSRLVGDPPDVVLSPRVRQVALMEFERGAETIEEGERTVRRMQPVLQDLL